MTKNYNIRCPCNKLVFMYLVNSHMVSLYSVFSFLLYHIFNDKNVWFKENIIEVLVISPDKWIPSAKAYGKYENVNISPNSSEGVFLKSTYFKSNALINPHTTPMAAEPKNMTRNRPTAENTAWVLLVICTEGSAYSNTVLKEHARYMYIKGVTVLTKAYSLKFIAC